MAIHKLKFFACRESRYLAEKIAKSFGSELGDSTVLMRTSVRASISEIVKL